MPQWARSHGHPRGWAEAGESDKLPQSLALALGPDACPTTLASVSQVLKLLGDQAGRLQALIADLPRSGKP